jgi:hypothetical protein
MAIISVNNLAEAGIITDQLPMQLPINAWSSGSNVRFTDNKVEKTPGWEVYRDTGLNWDGGSGEQVYWTIPYNDGSSPLWIYAGLKDVRVYDGTTDKEITRASGYYNATASKNWTGGILSNILVINNGADLPQSWDGDFSTPSKLIELANFSSQADRCGSMRVYKNYLVALDVTKSNVRYRSLVKWSNSAALGELPDSWDATDTTVDAGETDLSEKTKDVNIGALIDCLPLRNTNIIYSDSQVWAMDFIGGTFVFNFRQIFKNNGILSRRCVQEFEGKHFVVGSGDVYVHDGNTLKSVIDAKRRRFLFADMDADNYLTTYVFANYSEKEMWVCYPQAGSVSGLPNKALIWNWISNTWGQKDLPEGTYGTPHISSGIVDTSIVSDSWAIVSGTWLTIDRVWDKQGFSPQEQSPLICADKLYKGDSTDTQAGTNMVSIIERTDIPLGEDDVTVRIKALYPKMSGNVAVNVYVGSHKAPGDSPSYATPVLFTPGSSKKIDVRKTGTHMAVKFESTGDQNWCLYGYEAEIDPVGRR